MEMQRESSFRGVGFGTGQFLILGGAAAAVLLCGAMPQGSLGLFLVVAAFSLLVLPVRASLPPPIWIGSGLVVALGALALAPAAWFPSPAWRTRFVESGLFGGLERVSVTPLETAFWMMILGSSVVLAAFLLSNPVDAVVAGRLAAAASVVCALYGGLAVAADSWGWVLPFDPGPTFGFLANRNHVSTFLVTGAIAGAGALVSGLADRHYVVAVLGGIGLVMCSWAVLLESPSRGGVAALVAGMGLWFVGWARWRLPLVVTSGCLALVAAAYFVGTDNPVFRRLAPGTGESAVELVSGDFRFKIFRDALRMAADYPLTGSGFGTYRLLSPMYAEASVVEARTIHPESDWLMLLIEAGLPSLAAVGFLIWAVFKGVFASRNAPGWEVRWALICAALAAAFHGFVDVPLHRIEVGWWVLILACVGLAPSAAISRRPSGLVRAGFAAAGIGMGVLGIRLLSAQWGGGRALPPFAPEVEQKKIFALFESGRSEDAYDRAVAASREWPMDRVLRYQHGTMALQFVGTDDEVDGAFLAERLLNPVAAQIPRDQGEAWFSVDPVRSARLWADAVRRQGKIEQNAGRPDNAGLGLFSQALARMQGNPAALTELRPGPDQPASLHLAWLRVTPEPHSDFDKMGSDERFLRALSGDQRAAFLSLWLNRGEAAELEEFLRHHPDWEPDTWAMRIKMRLAEENFQSASEVLHAHFGISRDLNPRPGIPAADLAEEYARFTKARNDVAARRILEEAAAQGGDRAVEAHRLRALHAAEAGDWKQAYSELIRHLKASGRDPSPQL